MAADAIRRLGFEVFGCGADVFPLLFQTEMSERQTARTCRRVVSMVGRVLSGLAAHDVAGDDRGSEIGHECEGPTASSRP